MKQFALLFLVALFFSCDEIDCDEVFEPVAPAGYTMEQLSIINPDYGSSSDLSEFQMVNATTGFAISPGGLNKTIDGGRTWSLIPLSINNNILDALFTDENTGYISHGTGDGGALIMKTTDGGLNWDNFEIDGFDYTFGNLQADGFGNLYALSQPFGTDFVVKSTNGGADWTEIYRGDEVFNSLMTVNGDRLYFMESDDRLTVLDLDGNLVKSSTIGGYEQLIVLDENNIISVDQYQVYMTSDGGDNWTELFDDEATIIGYSNEDGLLMLVSRDICTDSSTNPTSFARADVNSTTLDFGTRMQGFDVYSIYAAEKVGNGHFILQHFNQVLELKRQ